MNETTTSVELVVVQLTGEIIDTYKDRIGTVKAKIFVTAGQEGDPGDDLCSVNCTIQKIKETVENDNEAVKRPISENLGAIRDFANSRQNHGLEKYTQLLLRLPTASPPKTNTEPAVN